MTANDKKDVLLALGVLVGMGATLYLSKHITDKATYESCKNGFANLIKEYQSTQNKEQRTDKNVKHNPMTESLLVEQTQPLPLEVNSFGSVSINGKTTQELRKPRSQFFNGFRIKYFLDVVLRIALLFLIISFIFHLLNF